MAANIDPNTTFGKIADLPVKTYNRIDDAVNGEGWDTTQGAAKNNAKVNELINKLTLFNASMGELKEAQKDTIKS